MTLSSNIFVAAMALVMLSLAMPTEQGQALPSSSPQRIEPSIKKMSGAGETMEQDQTVGLCSACIMHPCKCQPCPTFQKVDCVCCQFCNKADCPGCCWKCKTRPCQCCDICVGECNCIVYEFS